jgi:hypothetical protein
VFAIAVTNGTQQPLDELVISNQFETALDPDQATEGNKWLAGNALGWKIASLPAGRTIRREIQFKCVRETPRACNRVTVSAKDTPPVNDEACLEITGDQSAAAAPAAQPGVLNVSVADTADPIHAGGETTYQVLVENKGTTSQFNVVLAVTLSDEIALANIKGPVQGAVLPGSVRFAAIRELRAGEPALAYELQVKAVRAGTARIHAAVESQGQSRPVTAEQTTQVLP